MRLKISLFLGLLLSRASGAEMPHEQEYPNKAEVLVGTARVVVGASAFRHDMAETLKVYLGVENPTGDTLIIPNPALITPIAQLVVVPIGCEPNDYSSECWPGAYHFPEFVFFYGSPLVILPGQFKEYRIAWDAPSFNQAPPAGSYRLIGGFVGNDGYHFPQGGLSVYLELDRLVSVRSTSWGELKTAFR